MKRRFFTLSFVFFAWAAYPANEVISIHPVNFYMLGKGQEVFYPLAINADFLFSPGLTAEQIDQTLAKWSALGINTLRIRIDSLHAPDDPLNLFLEENGRLKPEIVSRLDGLIDAAKQHNMFVILVLFDVQRLAIRWDSSPYQKANGGSFEQLTEWFTDTSQLSKSLEYVTQLVERYKERNILSWELARGANVWDLNSRSNNRLMEGVSFWVVRMANQIRKVDDRSHPIALSFLPNSYPHTLLGLPQISLHFLQIESGNDLLLAQSVAPYINSIRNIYKKPCFVVEHSWLGEAGNRDSLMYNLVWASFATGSAAFYSPVNRDNQFHISDSDFQLIQTLKWFLPEIDLSGVPRPIVSPAELVPKDSYLSVESIFGYDRIFWILRKQPATAKAFLSLNTIEGKYRMSWMDPLTGIKHPLMNFNQLRKSLKFQTPEFERSLLGVLRLVKRAEPKKDPSAGQPAVKEQQE